MRWLNVLGTGLAIVALGGLAGCNGQTNNPLVRAQPSVLANLPFQPFMPLAPRDSAQSQSTEYANSTAKSSAPTSAADSSTGSVPAKATVTGRGVLGTKANKNSKAGSIANFPSDLTSTPSHNAEAVLLPENTGDQSISNVPDIKPVTAGTYTFTVPKSISSFKKSGETLQEFLLYYGVPTANQKPFVTMVVARHLQTACVKNPMFRVQSHRKFILNGLFATEYTGYTTAGQPFAELLLSHGKDGDKLEALAIVPNNKQRKIALKILQSIHWKPN